MQKLIRVFKHLSSARWQVARHFPRPSMMAIENAIKQSETTHMGELRVAIEAGLDFSELLAGTDSHQRALQVFSQLRVWDTEQNSGVLIYLLLADRKVEIIADRGIHAKVGKAGWSDICRDMESRFRTGDFESGVLQGIGAISTLLQQHFPAEQNNPNELPDRPVVL
jgi:uncharacterized membrane protein